MAEGLGFEARRFQVAGDSFVFHLLSRSQLKNDGEQKALLLDASSLHLRQHLFEQNALVGDVLIDDPKAVAAGGDDEAIVELA